MKVIKQDFNLNELEFYQTHLKVLNAVLPINITNKEIEILAEFMTLPKELTNGNLFNTQARKNVSEKLSLKEGGMNNHIKNMKKKGLIIGNTNELKIAPALIPSNKVQGYDFKLINTET